MERIPLCLRLADEELTGLLTVALPVYLPVAVHAGPPGDGDIVLVDHPGASAARRSIILPPRPLRLGIVLDRVAALLGAAPDADIVFGDFRLAADDLDLRRGDRLIRLTEKEAALLRCLHAAGGGPVERAVLLADIWGYADGLDTHTVETHVYRLRQKIEADPALPACILTDGSAYRLARSG